ncbi:hypothetical protein [uncultured Roseibium sp.]|uniref:hypothetical protein n=1 Tax=uncultured Roseibium sp. TaxID=1936171 RepID=UPI002620DDE0|nr:hypothetical protein [uncultured Roseibium sp.]
MSIVPAALASRYAFYKLLQVKSQLDKFLVENRSSSPMMEVIIRGFGLLRELRFTNYCELAWKVFTGAQAGDHPYSAVRRTAGRH